MECRLGAVIKALTRIMVALSNRLGFRERNRVLRLDPDAVGRDGAERAGIQDGRIRRCAARGKHGREYAPSSAGGVARGIPHNGLLGVCWWEGDSRQEPGGIRRSPTTPASSF